MTPAVSYLAWHGTTQTFDFTNPSYLAMFLDANARKNRSDVREVHTAGSMPGGLLWCLAAGVLLWWLASQTNNRETASNASGPHVQAENASASSLSTSGHPSKSKPLRRPLPAPGPAAMASELDRSAESQKKVPQNPDPGPDKGIVQDILAPMRIRDQQAADRIASYCAAATAKSTDQASAQSGCQRDEVGAWTRIVLDNEFPTLDESTRQQCLEPLFPYSYVAKEGCVKFELHAAHKER